jgi:hypothetical protein
LANSLLSSESLSIFPQNFLFLLVFIEHFVLKFYLSCIHILVTLSFFMRILLPFDVRYPAACYKFTNVPDESATFLYAKATPSGVCGFHGVASHKTNWRGSGCQSFCREKFTTKEVCDSCKFRC